MNEIKVLIIDDSAIVRELLKKHLAKVAGIDVVGTAPDAYVARELIVKLKPDVLTLDIEMPRMNGLTFLRQLMKSYPLPVVVVSSLLHGQNELTMTALQMGAVDVVPKPGGAFSISEVVELLAQKIVAASKADVAKINSQIAAQFFRSSQDENLLSRFETTDKIIAFGASTGGTIALEKLAGQIGSGLPPIVTVIHMPQGFTRSFAKRLNGLSSCSVVEGKDNEVIRPGHMYIAPGNFHCEVVSRGTERRLRIFNGPKVQSCRPSVDVLFRSLAREAGKNAFAAVLTGMGKDGAQGLLEMKNAGAYTVAQDEPSSIVYGMPREAAAMGAANKILSLREIIPEIERRFL